MHLQAPLQLHFSLQHRQILIKMITTRSIPTKLPIVAALSNMITSLPAGGAGGGHLSVDVVISVNPKMMKHYQLSHGCQGDTEKYLTRGNLYHPRHTCITRDVVEGNTGVSRVIQVFEGQIISPYHPGNHVITTLSHRRNYKLL